MAFDTPKSRRTGTRGLPVLALVVVCAFACDGRNTGPDVSTSALHVQIGTALPPAGLQNTGVRELVRGLYAETLVISDRNGSTRPRLCEKWEWLEGGTVLRLRLREGISFHDGSPLNAATAAALLKRTFADDKYPFTYRSVKGIDVLDELTLQIRLSTPEALLVEDLTDARITKETIGTGPFVLDTLAEQSASLRRFDAYHQGRPGLDRVEIKAYPSLRGAWTAMMRGEINMLHEVSRDAAPFVEAESSVHAYPMLRSYISAVLFNVRHPVLARREVRQALSYAIDRDAIVRDVMGGRGERADSPVWKYHWAYSTAQRTYDYNPDLARLKLDAAGLPPRTSAGQMPSRFTFTCLVMNNDSRHERMALVLQKQLYAVGVDMRIEALPLKEMVTRFGTPHFDAVFAESISGRSLTWVYRRWRSKSNPLPGELNAGYTAADAALDRLRGAFGEPEVKRAVGDLQAVFYDDPPALFVAWPQISRAVSASIHVPHENNVDIIGRIWRFQRPQIAQR